MASSPHPSTPHPDQPPDALLVAANISKAFGITQALSDVSVSFRRGEVHALMGENGAGKSTLGKVISGLHKQDQGTVSIGGHELRPGSIDDAFAHGVRIVHQELAQCANLSVAENLCLHSLPTREGVRGLAGSIVDRHRMEERAARLLARLEPAIDVRTPLGDLSPGHRQIVQIASSLDESSGKGAHPASVIVLDEPTSSLAIAEVSRLLAIVRQLASEGLTLVYVSHRMNEIFEACDRVSVLRDGRFVATNTVAEIDESTLVEQMIGRKVPPPTPRVRTHDASEQSALRVEELSSPGKLHKVSFSVYPGEVLGIGGLVGAGRSELLDAIFGLDPRARGSVVAGGTTLLAPGSGHNGPNASIAAEVGYVPEDRKLQGLFFQLGIGENIAMPVLSRLATAIGVRRPGKESAFIDQRLRSFQVKAAGPEAFPGSLSGGNQQKLLIARWMGSKTRVLLLDEPTRGIDVGTKSEIYRLIREAAARGMAVVLVSSEMPELLALSDRIMVLCSGKHTGELDQPADTASTPNPRAMTQANILRLATVDDRAPHSAKLAPVA